MAFNNIISGLPTSFVLFEIFDETSYLKGLQISIQKISFLEAACTYIRPADVAILSLASLSHLKCWMSFLQLGREVCSDSFYPQDRISTRSERTPSMASSSKML